jgi:hypothetical protein
MSATPSIEAARYEPGACNIGPDEIRRRRRFGHAAALATATLLGVLLAVRAPRIARVLATIPAMGAASGYLQASERFCAGYGQIGVYNFGPAGSPTEVEDAAAREADRRKARSISLRSGLIGLGVGLAAALLPR